MSLLRKLYDGTLYPSEEIVCHAPRDQEIRQKINTEREYLMKLLSPEDAEHFLEFEELKNESSELYAYTNFSYGVKLGIQLMKEVTSDDDMPGKQADA